MRTLAASVALAAGIVAGCSLLPPSTPLELRPTVTETPTSGGMTYTVESWPFDGIVAMLCLRQPGDEFSFAHPKPDPAAGCAPLGTRKEGDRLTLAFNLNDIAPKLAAEFSESRGPWLLALAGAGGTTAGSIVIQVQNSPVPSDPGPS